MKENRTALYRHYDGTGRLLYVGISLSAINRLSEHRVASKWAESIERVDIEYLPDRSLAIAAERDAIIAERPLWNVAHNRIKQCASTLTVAPYEWLTARPETVEVEKELEELGVYFISKIDVTKDVIEVSGLGHRRTTITIDR